ncbi:MAG: putative glutathionylspermidine synthase, partial [bacterium]|nr:putative glutathionylspermidine synthase [bacterium]
MAHPHVHTYQALASELLATGIVSDPWLEGRPRFAVEPLLLGADEAAGYARAAEAVAAAYDEAARLLVSDPWLVEQLYPALTPFQHLMWSASAGAWHGIARADVFATVGPEPRIQICELNVDTPSGEAEAVLLNAAVARLHPGAYDPNVALERAFVNAVGAYAARVERRDAEAAPTVGILYPTELVEDLSMILLYRRWLEARGCRVVLGSPFNLTRAPGGRVALFDVPCDVLVRHYKTDWWSEREPARDDDSGFPDAEPLAAQLGIIVDAELAGRVAVMNPFGSVVLQNKRTMALLWEAIDRFTPAAQEAIRAFVPYTARLESLTAAALAVRADWVLKSDYG